MAGVGELTNSSDYFFFQNNTKTAFIFYDVTTSGEFVIITLTANI